MVPAFAPKIIGSCSGAARRNRPRAVRSRGAQADASAIDQRDLPSSRPARTPASALSDFPCRFSGLWPGAGRRSCFSEGTMQRGAAVSPGLGSGGVDTTLQPAPSPPSPRRSRGWSSSASSAARASTRSTKSSGRRAPRSSATRRGRSSSSSATSRCPGSGRSRPPTSSSRSISAARLARRSASAASSS